jgi:UDP-N-acetylmuramate--alanine ligase
VGVHQGHAAENVPIDVEQVVRSAAVPADNPEVRPGTIKYAEMVGRLTRMRRTIAVAGAHGKTTTTSMVTTILERAGLRPSFLCGGFIPQLGRPGAWRQSRDLVVEACEYDRSFLNYEVDCAIVTNIEADHLDYYRDLDEIREAFAAFAAQARHVIALPGTVEADETIGGTWRAENFRTVGGCWAFDVPGYGEFTLRVPGRHNVLNALAAMAAAHRAGVGLEIIQIALSEFTGAARRFQILGERGGVLVVDDYAHHPSEIRAVLRAARERFPDRALWCVFQPHQHSRTRRLMGDFAQAFGDADHVVVTETYSARDTETSTAAADLAARIPAEFVASKEAALKLAPPGSVMMTLGAGDIGVAARGYLEH